VKTKLPIPPGKYRLDDPQVCKLLNRTPEEMKQAAENLHKSAVAALRKQLYQFVWDGAGI